MINNKGSSGARTAPYAESVTGLHFRSDYLVLPLLLQHSIHAGRNARWLHVLMKRSGAELIPLKQLGLLLTVLSVQNLGLKRANCTASNRLLLPDPFLPTTAFVSWLKDWTSGCVRNDRKFDIMICLMCMASIVMWLFTSYSCGVPYVSRISLLRGMSNGGNFCVFANSISW